MRVVGDCCGCFPTGRPYPGIAHLLRSPLAGVVREIDPSAPWTEQPVAMIDTETTGRLAQHDRIVELAIVVGKAGAVVSRDTWVINPQCAIPAEASAVHGIYDADVVDKPVFADVAREIVNRFEGAIPAAYNASFDRGFLLAEVKRSLHAVQGEFPDVPATRDRVVWIDPLVWARHLYPDEKSRTLSAMAQLLGVNLSHAHRATDDAEAALLVMYELAKDKRVPKSYGDFIQQQVSHARAQEEARKLWRR